MSKPLFDPPKAGRTAPSTPRLDLDQYRLTRSAQKMGRAPKEKLPSIDKKEFPAKISKLPKGYG